MRIIILGAGQVGFTVASNLSHEHYDITIIDNDPIVVQNATERLDLSAICGNVTHPDVLENAGIKDADLLIAVTDSDETNIMACQIAHHLFQTPKKIARVRAQAFHDVKDQLFTADTIPIDVIISPENEIVNFIKNLIQHPGSQQVLSFANGVISLVETVCTDHCALVGNSLEKLSKMLKGHYARIIAIYRKGHIIIPKLDTEIVRGDRVFFIATANEIKEVLSRFFNQNKPYKRLMIAGGGRIGLGLAKALENDMQVKIITKDAKRAHRLSEQLDQTIVLCGDTTDEAFLMDENIDRTDVFCTLTSDDETNILCSMLAKNLGATVVMSLVDRSSYMTMVDNGSIDNAIYPQHTTIGSILSEIRDTHVAQVHSLLRGRAEAFEAQVTTDDGQPPVILGKTISNVSMPEGCIIVGLLRNGVSLPTRKDLVIEEGDRIIIFISNKAYVHQVEELFKPPKSLIKRIIQ